jgi:histidinol-phosphate aminotransferase
VAGHIDALKPYVPGKPISELRRELGIDDIIKLASNENPLGPSPAAAEAMRAVASQAHVYPDAAAFAFKEAVSRKEGVGVERIGVGNGSNELLTLLVRTFCAPGDTGVVCQYSFIAYRIIMQAAGLTWAEAPVGPGYEMDVDAILEAVTDTTRVVFVANPNNPTGTYLPHGEVARLARSLREDVILIVDEAYDDYVRADGHQSALALMDARERLVVTRTFSKVYGMGGARAGYMIAPAEMVGYVDRTREPFNVNAMAQAGAAAALFDEEFVARSVAVNEESRALLEEGLRGLNEAHGGISWIPSQTNFLLVETSRDGAALNDAMLRRGVIVRPMRGYGLPEALRISLGTPAEIARCVEALGESLAEYDGGRR